MEPRSRPADGFTVIEVVVAITVLVVALLGAALLVRERDRRLRATRATGSSPRTSRPQAMENVRGLAADPTKFATIPQGQTVFAGTGADR